MKARARSTTSSRTVPFARRGIADKLMFGIVAIAAFGGSGGVTRPEDILVDVLVRPFAPLEGASAECLEDSAIYLKALENYSPWALQMYDASAKISPGILTGNLKQIGNYDECLRVSADRGFVGQACIAKLGFELTSSDNYSRDLDTKNRFSDMAKVLGRSVVIYGSSFQCEWLWCVPSTCNYSEISEALDLALHPLRENGTIDVTVSVKQNSCRTRESDRAVFDVSDWIYTSLLLIFLATIVASTAYDLVKFGNCDDTRKDTRDTLMTSFSLYTNGKALLDIKKRDNSIACLDGLRFLSICWIIYSHTHYLAVVGVTLDISAVPTMNENWSTLFVLNANIVTDTFLLLSGILLSYTLLSRKQRNPDRTLNIFTLYVHRYLRLTPAYAMLIGFYATLFYKVGSGPQWDTWVATNRDYCKQNWWTNLLYVNNYVNLNRICMSQTWYLSMDMQLVWLSPIFIYPMLKFTRSLIFWTILGISLVASVLVPFFITYCNRLTATMLYYKDNADVAAVFTQIYTKTYARAGSYLVGLGVGCLLCRTRSQPLAIPVIYVIGGWMVAVTTGLAVVFGPRDIYFDHHTYDKLEASFYAGLHRQAFAVAVSWIIFTSVHGYAGPVGKFLSWRGWMPLGRLSYSAYLCHYIVLLYNVGSARTPGYLSIYNVVQAFFGNLTLVMILSAVVSLCFEMPFVTLNRVLTSGAARRQSQMKSSAKVFGTTDSTDEIYRSTDDSISTVSCVCDNVVDRPKDGSA